MNALNRHAPGTFCWVELATPDRTAAKRFYGEILGWSFCDQPIPGDTSGTYTMIRLGDLDLGGMHEQSGAGGEGAPPHFASYVAVADVDAVAAETPRLGGAVLAAPFEIPGVGRMAALRDPAGGAFCIWAQENPHPGYAHFAPGAPGSVIWNELVSTDVDACRDFYCQLFRWRAEIRDMGHVQYTVFRKADRGVAGMMAKAPEMGPVPSFWVVYFCTANVDAACDAATARGGRALMPPFDVKDIGRICWIQDPHGAMCAVISPASS